MTKRYFVSYIHCNVNATTYGHCIMQVNNGDLTSIIYTLQEANNFDTLPTIICLKDLSKKEYRMLRGKGNDNDFDPFMTYRPRITMKFSDKIPKAVDSPRLREFSIKGHKIMAYSKKDAITRLKHLKKL